MVCAKTPTNTSYENLKAEALTHLTSSKNQIAAPKSTSTLVFGLFSMFQFILCCGWATGGLLGIILGMVALDKAATANEYYEEDPDSYTSKSMTFVKVGKIVFI